jgi:hypothetical protein
MGQVRVSVRFAVAGGLAAVALVLAAPAGAAAGCGQRLLGDWRDGRIDGTYPVACYREALAQLPEDLRVYSSAPGDITRALQTRVTEVEPEQLKNAGDGGGVSPLLVVVVTAAVLVAAGSVAAALR